MDNAIPDKAYFRIGEVSRILGVEPYVIRYWETEFRTVRPERTSADQRVYRRRDLEELLAIKSLLYTEKFTIQGAKREMARRKGEGTPLPSPPDVLTHLRKGLEEIRDILAKNR